ncbi:hypothetical protein BABINDRAFT_161774, partial [Babjeviella inositovora NRRL Y-12698]
MNFEDLETLWDRQEEAEEVPAPETTGTTNPDHTADDLLGLNTDIKIINRTKRVKLDNSKLLDDDVKGLNYIRKNYRKIKLTSRKSSHKTVTRKSIQETPEYINLTRLLNFYQIWAHQLFPRANFTEFIETLQTTDKANYKLRETRQSWLDFEADGGFKGITRDDGDMYLFRDIDGGLSDTEFTTPAQTKVSAIAESVVPGSNSLFVGDDSDEELYHTAQTATINPEAAKEAASAAVPSVTNILGENGLSVDADEFDDWSDSLMDEFDANSTNIATVMASPPGAQEMAEVEAEMNAKEGDFDDEMDVLR